MGIVRRCTAVLPVAALRRRWLALTLTRRPLLMGSTKASPRGTLKLTIKKAGERRMLHSPVLAIGERRTPPGHPRPWPST